MKDDSKKIVVLKSDEEKVKDIWHEEEIVVAPEALDVVSDPRIRPEYDVKYQQYVGTEDAFLQVIEIEKKCYNFSLNQIRQRTILFTIYTCLEVLGVKWPRRPSFSF